ncbi:MAG TPA: flap structure-specific endonuclease, partial [Candidatus Nanoarchaeia archaeon]|nr:flap structure-specific endonuclease [Candidatus Nanoarchaeia archaeon]
EEEMGKYARQFSWVNSQMFDESKLLLQALGLPVIQAPSEAEAQCAYMAKKKVVWAAASQDYDSLLFGAPRLILNLTLSQKRKVAGGKQVYISPYLIELDSVLEKLHLTQDQLIVLGILIGTDYNPGGVPGIGPKKALKLVQSEKSFEKIFSSFSVDFDWKEIFDTFKDIPVNDVSLKFGALDEEKVKELLVEQHDFSMDRVESTLEKLRKGGGQTLKKWF